MNTYIELNNQLNIPNNGKIQLDKDKEAVRAFFLEHVNKNTVFFYSLEEKISYLIREGYIDKTVITDKYSMEFIKKLFKFIYSKKFRFDTFMGAYRFYKQYAMKTDDGERYLERYEDRVAFNALTMGDGDEELAMKIADELINRRYQPATPTFLNAGRLRRGEYVSCFLIQVEDSMSSIGRTLNSALQLSKLGGGVGINLSNLRALGDPIKGIEGAGSGVVPVMKMLEDGFRYANQLGQRQGAGAVYLNVFHADIMDFLSTRKENAESAKQIKTLSLGVVVPDKFYELAESGDVIHLFSPYDVAKEYGVPFSFVDIDSEYNNMIQNPNIRSKVMNARDLEEEISRLQQESGYPYIMNVSTVNKANPIDGKIVMSNLCSEILQVQTPSKLNDEQVYEELGTDISCNLGSINILNLLETSNDVVASIETMVRALTYITDVSNIKAVPTIKNGNDKAHTIGLGAMGLNVWFASNQVEYGSPESIEMTDALFELINYATLVASNKIAKERGTTFHNFENSKYADGSYFDEYVPTLNQEISSKVAEVFDGVVLPNVKDWETLRNSIIEGGLYHQNRLAVAPNGSIAYVNETTSSLHPIISMIEERQDGKTGKTYYPAPRLSEKTIPYYKSAYNTSMIDVINVYATAQKHIDQGMSLTLFMRSELPENLYPWKVEGGATSTRDLTLLRHYAWKKGIKTIYYVRTFTEEDGSEVGVSECESCTI